MEATNLEERPQNDLTIPYLAVHEQDGERTMLYRFYDQAGDLLYVGVTHEPGRRWAAHSRHSEWWPRVAVLHTEWHPTREVAEAEEVRAIERERPAFNRKHNGRQYRYRSGRFQATRLHPIVREHYGSRPFSFPDLVAELGIPTGSVTAYGNRLVAAGKFQRVGRWKGPTGLLRNYYVAVPLVDENVTRPPAE